METVSKVSLCLYENTCKILMKAVYLRLKKEKEGKIIMADKIIALACAAGMSTSLLVSKMQKAAADKGLDYEIFAKSTADIDNMLAATPKPDVLLLGPQVGFMKAEVQKKAQAADVPMDVIKMQDYGMMRGDKVLEAAEALMK